MPAPIKPVKPAPTKGRNPAGGTTTLDLREKHVITPTRKPLPVKSARVKISAKAALSPLRGRKQPKGASLTRD